MWFVVKSRRPYSAAREILGPCELFGNYFPARTHTHPSNSRETTPCAPSGLTGHGCPRLTHPPPPPTHIHPPTPLPRPRPRATTGPSVSSPPSHIPLWPLWDWPIANAGANVGHRAASAGCRKAPQSRVPPPACDATLVIPSPGCCAPQKASPSTATWSVGSRRNEPCMRGLSSSKFSSPPRCTPQVSQ